LQNVLREMENVRNRTQQEVIDHKKRMKDQYSVLENVVENFNAVNARLLAQVQ